MAKALVPRRDVGKPGPAMAELAPRAQKFVRMLLQTGSNNHTLAAKMAGYTGSDETIRVTAHRLAHDKRVLAAIKEEGEKRMHTGIILATSVLMEIAADPLAKDRLKAAVEILNRTGLHAKSEHNLNVNHEHRLGESEKALLMEVNDQCRALGIDPQKLLGPAYVEGAFTEVEPEAETEEHSNEGLEDLL